MEEKEKTNKKASAKESGTYKPRAKKVSPKKEYVVVLVKPNVLIVSLDGVTNTRIARTGKLKDLVAGDKVKL